MSSHSSQDRGLNILKQSCSKDSGLSEDSLRRPARTQGSAAVMHQIKGVRADTQFRHGPFVFHSRWCAGRRLSCSP